MKKQISSFVFSVLLCLSASAATVEWGVLSFSGWNFDPTENRWQGTVSADGYRLVATGETIYPFLLLTGEKQGIKVMIKAGEVSILEFGDNWIQVNEGDLVNARSTQNLESYFLFGMADAQTGEYNVHADETITRNYASTFQFYLGFATSVMLENPDDNYETWKQHVYYGWAQFEYANGELALVNSAINGDGGGIYVGTDRTTPIPEPATAGLALLGWTLLLQRRKIASKA